VTDAPNLVVQMTDQQAASTLGAYGNERVETPNLDAFAGEAARFENAYCTQPVCTPSRSSILTGRYPHETGCVENSTPLPSNEACLPELLDEEYTAAFMGKWHLGDEIFPQHGFDERVSTEDMYRSGYSDSRPADAHSTYYEYLIEQGFEPDTEDDDGFERFSRTWKTGDRVMQTRNNYDLEVFNGDIGRIRDIDEFDETVEVDFEGRAADYDFGALDQLALAYAITVHKSQGNEYPAVVIPVVTQHYIMLQRNLLYTAVTRARELVVLVGSKRAVRIAVENDVADQRYTRLAERVRGIP